MPMYTGSETVSDVHTWNTLRHSHGAYEMHIILGGGCRVEVEAFSHNLKTGDALLIAPGKYHQPLRVEEDFARFVVLFFPGNQLQEKLRSIMEDSLVIRVDDMVLRNCREVVRECAGENPYKNEQIQALLTLLMIRVLRSLPLVENQAKVFCDPYELERISAIDDFFENHYAENGGEAALAQQLNLSKRQLSRVLQKHYAMGYRQKLICSRMDQAAWLLRNTQMQVAQIAQEVGYVSESAFFQVFRKYFEITPQQYRKEAGRKGNKKEISYEPVCRKSD